MKNWYIVQTFSSFEKKVADTIKETVKNKIVNSKGETVIINKINNHQSVILKNKEHYTILWRNHRVYKV